jgi:S-adenosylmethionine/arginine decarboxylase-like enzyme
MKIQSTLINLYECDKILLVNPEKIGDFVLELCDVIGMQPHGKPIVQRFGKGDLEGYSSTILQFIETSSITIHLDEVENKVFIDICSCKDFDSALASDFSKKYFGAKESKFQEIERK